MLANITKYSQFNEICHIGFKTKLFRPLLAQNRELVGWCKRVRVVANIKGEGECKQTFLQYGGDIMILNFEPGRWHWSGNLGKLHSYSAKMGRTQILRHRTKLQKPIGPKWCGNLPPTFEPRWNEVWFPHRPQKDAGFIWSMYHCAIAVNA